MRVEVEDGRAVALGGDPDHRFTQGFLCAKVNHYLERVYSPDRILHPLRRVGLASGSRCARRYLKRSRIVCSRSLASLPMVL